MNIFFVDADPRTAAEALVDKHVVKMIIESAQLLSIAHRVLDGKEYQGISASGSRKVKRWKLAFPMESTIYQATHVNHPSAKWVRKSAANYDWLYSHFIALIGEYNHRYGKIHACNARLAKALINVPANIPNVEFTWPPSAMPQEYIISENSVDCYREYYIKGKKHLHKWTGRPKPSWIPSGAPLWIN